MTTTNDAGKHFKLHHKQGVALLTHATEILYGGAAGGGKSHLMRVAAITWCRAIPGLQVYIFRRTMGDLFKNHMEGPTSFPAMLADWEKANYCKINYSQSPSISFPNGSKIHLNHCQLLKHIYNYQGAEIHVLMIDELTHWLAQMYYYLRGRVRLGGLQVPDQYKGLFPRILCGANPGGVGHTFVKNDFIDVAPHGEITQMPDEEGGMLRQYIPAKLEDNPTLGETDPNYEKRLAGLGNPALVRAMRHGDWDIVSGGMFDDVWDRAIHVIPKCSIPKSWRIDRSFDWGSSKPFSVGWWAESDGSDLILPDGESMPTVRGDTFRIAEWYGWNGKANEGCRMLASEIAREIKKREKDWGIAGRVRPGPADSSIFDAQNGNCIADDMSDNGVIWERADKSPGSRKQGWEAMRKLLKAALPDPEAPEDAPREAKAVFIMENCTHFIRTVPVLPRSDKDADDVNTDAEDHCFAAGTLVDTEDGQVPIEQLVGTTAKVFSVDGGLHEFSRCWMTRRNADVVRVTLTNGKTITCTPDHRFLTESGDWMEAALLLGETCFIREGLAKETGCVSVISVEPAGKADVYCLDVPGPHCFSVEGGIIVHNCADESRYRLFEPKKVTKKLKIKGF